MLKCLGENNPNKKQNKPLFSSEAVGKYYHTSQPGK